MELACRAYMAEPERVDAANWPTPLDESRAAATRATLKRVLEAALAMGSRLMRGDFRHPFPMAGRSGEAGR